MVKSRQRLLGVALEANLSQGLCCQSWYKQIIFFKNPIWFFNFIFVMKENAYKWSGGQTYPEYNPVLVIWGAVW